MALDGCIFFICFQIKTNQSSKKLNYSRAVQCIHLPSECKDPDITISEILQTQDHRHVLVVLKGTSAVTGFLVLYSLDFSDKMLKILENPVSVRELSSYEQPVEVKLLPTVEKIAATSTSGGVKGSVVMVCGDGAVRIVELATLKTVCYGKIDEAAFVSAAYCNSKF